MTQKQTTIKYRKTIAMYRNPSVLCFLLCLSIVYTELKESVEIINHKKCLYVRYGENLEIFCRAGEGYSSKDLVFKFGGKIEPFEIVNDTTIRLYKEKPEARGFHVYLCKNTATLRNSLQAVVIASPPRNVTDFQCISRNLEDLKCEWRTWNRFVNTNYSLTPWLRGYPLITCERPHADYGGITECVFRNISPFYFYVRDDEILQFTLQSSNIFEEIEQEFFIDNYSIVKPAAPLNLKAVRVDSHEVLLQWEIHNNLYFILQNGKGLDHRIEYRIKGDYELPEINKTKEVDATGLPASNSTYYFRLDLPYAYVIYEIKIRIKTKEANREEFWSDPGTILITTESESPGRPPETAVGAFLQSGYENYRNVIILWKELQLYERSGPNFKYKVEVGTSVSTETLFVDESLGRYKYTNAPLTAFDIRIWSLNEAGMSTSISYMHVPDVGETISQKVNRFTILKSGDGVYEFLWDEVENVDNYTLFWIDIEKKRFQYKYLQPKENQHTLHLGVGNEYEFYIAANKGTTTTGMVSANDCELQSKNFAMYNFPVNLIKESVERTKAKLKWLLRCKLSDGIVSEYRAVLRGLDTEYLNEWNMKAYNHMEIEIVDLKPHRKYLFTLSLKTKIGTKNILNTTLKTLEGTPDKPRDLAVTDTRNESIFLSWEHPHELNGNSKHIVYKIHYNEENNRRSHKDQAKYMEGRMIHQISNLNAYTSYSIKIQACNTEARECSNVTQAVTVKTRMGEPSAPVHITLNEQLLSWDPPLNPRGNITMYEILIQKGNNSNIVNNITNVIYSVFGCEMTGQIVTYKIRAINYEDGVNYKGKWSDEISDRCPNHPYWLYFAAGVLVLLTSAKISSCLYKKWHKMKIEEPIFPAGVFVLQNDTVKHNKHDVINKNDTDKSFMVLHQKR